MTETLAGADSGAAKRALAPEWPLLRRAALISTLSGLLWLPLAGSAALALAGLLEGRLPALALASFLLFGALRAVLAMLAEAVAQRAALAATSRLRGGVLAQVARRAALPRAGGFASLVGEQAALIRPYAARYVLAQMRVTVLPVAVFLCAFSTSWAAGLILLIAGPAIPVFMALIGHAAGRASREQLQDMGSLSALLADRIGALPDIRLLGASAALGRDFARAAEGLRRASMRVLGIAFLSSTVLEFFAALGIAMMAVFCGFSLLGEIGFGTWGAPLSPAQALFLLLIAPEFFQPLRDLAAAWHDRASADAAALALDQATAPQARMAGQGARAPALPHSVLVLQGVVSRGVSFPDLDLPAGAALAVTGPSGAGKSTLLRLIAGLEQADAGVILLDGMPLGDGNADAWRAALGWMPQGVHFVDDTLEANLRMGRPGDLTPALSGAAAAHLIAALPEGLATRLGERGAGLSGGEGRRLTLARALHAAPRLIVADEPTADLDAATAAEVTRGLLAAHRAGAGLIVATHDPALVATIGREYRLGAG
ncbi:ABC transporter ATP-binding protein/permease [Paracoccus lutimaris]|uniref:ATP-binding cassette subfamily C protein CydD n=1 Tax=Paracoccus lutimaris TaxID=1490030 RepID=A0A368Z1D7_9RHOB|nr:ATP-binding cassette domain-containing protein [Paracoccus lutimaris]RCW85047.1 ATP-binding cassette subfamily C protein CydD [Paracoccus lutimaris]